MAVSKQNMMSDSVDDNLTKLLIERGKLRETDLAGLARMRQEQKTDEHLSYLIVKLGMVSERDMAQALASLLDLSLAASSDYAGVDLDADTLSARFLKEAHAVPIAEEEGSIVVAMADPQDDYTANAIAMACGRSVARWVGVASEIDTAIEQLYGEGKSTMGQIVGEVEVSEEVSEADVEQLKDLASEAPVIRLVNLIIQRATETQASDIHFEPFENQLKVRYRIDGVLQEAEAPAASLTAAVISRIKIMANLNIAERRLPQDGRIKLRVQGKDIDVRVSTVPTMYGESVVMRLLNRESVVLDFSSLGLEDETLDQLVDALKHPHGMLLVTGPTGSGKTTTLYTALNSLNTSARKIITVEDPVEYQLDGINQIQVKHSIGLTFSNALRSIVRQDPDVIMVGEMRDIETARICVQSALTGHLVLSTLHTNDAASSVTRLIEMGVEDYLLTSTLNVVIAQRLVRVLCKECRQPHHPTQGVIDELGLKRFAKGNELTLFKPEGCEHCSGTGYRGRTAILELLSMTDTIRSLIMNSADAGEIHKVAQSEGMHTMYEDGLKKVVAGVTALEEVMRVTQES